MYNTILIFSKYTKNAYQRYPFISKWRPTIHPEFICFDWAERRNHQTTPVMSNRVFDAFCHVPSVWAASFSSSHIAPDETGGMSKVSYCPECLVWFQLEETGMCRSSTTGSCGNSYFLQVWSKNLHCSPLQGDVNFRCRFGLVLFVWWYTTLGFSKHSFNTRKTLKEFDMQTLWLFKYSYLIRIVTCKGGYAWRK
jgi:hypothetical protein